MHKNFTWSLAVLLCILSQTVTSQTVKQVFVDNNKRLFNDGNPLPAEHYFQVTGGIPAEVSLIKFELYKNPGDKTPLYVDSWKRHFSDNGRTFYIPVDYKLQSNRTYSITMTYYETLRGDRLGAFRDKVHSNLRMYVEAVTTNTDAKIRLNGSVQENLRRLNNIMRDSYRYYESHHSEPFAGFSDIVSLKLQQLRDAGLENARFNIDSDSTLSNSAAAQQYSKQLQDQLIALLHTEADNYISTGVRMVYDQVNFKDYRTEKTKSFLPLNVGYGAVYLGGSFNDLEYDAQPYAGISIPLANPRFKRFLGNASVSFGVFIRDFEDKQGNRLTGPLINKPFYLGLGYKIFDFLKFNAGAVALSQDRLDLNNFKTEKVSIHPFGGVSAEFNIFFGGNR